MKLTNINGKYSLILPDHRADRPEWATGWETERIESMLSNLKKGDLVLDIGTEEGDISALLSQKTGEIILFEPNPKVWPNIRAIWEANKLLKPVGYYVGFASSRDKHSTPDYAKYNREDDFWPECAFGELIGNHGFKELSDSGDIPEIKIDTFMSALPSKKVRLITLDVEGSEFEVIKGAVEIIKRDKPLIYISIHPTFMADNYSQRVPDLKRFIVDLGYKENLLAYDHELHAFYEPI